MSKFYGVLDSCNGRNQVTKCGHKCIVTSARSYNGSITTELNYNDNGELMVVVRICEGSGNYGDVYFKGTFEEFKKQLSK